MLSPSLRAELAPEVAIDKDLILGEEIKNSEHSNAAVYEGKNGKAEQPVVIKIYDMDEPEDDIYYGVTRFARELTVGTTLRHPNVLPIIGCGVVFGNEEHTASEQYTVTPLCNQGTLADQILDIDDKQEAALTWHILLDALEGAHAMHKDDYVHADICPSNIMVQNFRGLLGDHGSVVARRDTERAATEPFNEDLLAIHEVTLATAPYASPEQLYHYTEEALSPASDLFSWGLTTLALMNGRHPYAKHFHNIDKMHFEGARWCLERLGVERRPDRPSELYDLLEHCLKPEATERPQDITEVIAIGRTILSLEAISDSEQLITR